MNADSRLTKRNAKSSAPAETSSIVPPAMAGPRFTGGSNEAESIAESSRFASRTRVVPAAPAADVERLAEELALLVEVVEDDLVLLSIEFKSVVAPAAPVPRAAPAVAPRTPPVPLFVPPLWLLPAPAELELVLWVSSSLSPLCDSSSSPSSALLDELELVDSSSPALLDGSSSSAALLELLSFSDAELDTLSLSETLLELLDDCSSPD